MKNSLQYLFGCILALLLMNGCSGNKDNSLSAPTLSLTPKMLFGFAGNDWNKVKPTLSGKKGYKYTEFTSEENPGIKAVVSQPVTLAGYEVQHYLLTLNIARLSNMVAIVSLDHDESVTTLTLNSAYSLMEQFYADVFSKLTDTSFTYCSYKLGAAMEKRISVKEALDKIENREPVDKLHFEITGEQGGFIMLLNKSAVGNFIFSYESHKGY